MPEPMNPMLKKQLLQILIEKSTGKDLDELLDEADQLIDLAIKVEKPDGRTATIVASFLELAANELRPKSMAYAGYMLGVAVERYRNKKRT